MDTFPYLGSLITEDGECTTEFRTRLNRGQAIGASLQKMWKSHSIPISTKIRLMKALVWPVAMHGPESWTLKKNEETRLDAFEMKGLRKILRVSWTAYKQKSGSWSRPKEETVRHRQSKEASIQWSHHEETKELHGERDNARNNARCTHARPGWTTSRCGQDSSWKSQSE